MDALTPEERAELAARSSLITMYRRTADLLESENRLYIRHLLTARDLDPSKQYSIDNQSGEITLIEAEQEG